MMVEFVLSLLLALNGFQGAVLVAKEGKVLFSQGFGYANVEHQVKNTPETVFRIGSLTKQFTAAAILLLQEKGLLDVKDPIKKYLPDYPRGEEITIHHLLSHSAGIPNITDFPNLSELQRIPSTPESVINLFKHLPLKFEPGSDCAYTNSGYIVLGAILEKVTKKPYEKVLKENFFAPLGMKATCCDQYRALIPNRASGYVKDEQGVRHANYIDMSFPFSSGGLVSTVEDLFTWDRALKEGKILTKESREALFKIQASSEANHITYGYGFRIGPSTVFHFGSIEGFVSSSVRTLNDDLTIILLSNLEGTDLHSLSNHIDSLWRNAGAN